MKDNCLGLSEGTFGDLKIQDSMIITFVNKTQRVNFFSWISIKGPGKLLTYSRINSEFYCNEILPVMICELKEQFGENFLVIYDNARFSSSEYTNKFRLTSGFDKYFILIPP